MQRYYIVEILAGEFISLINSMAFPVSPINPVFERANGERMFEHDGRVQHQPSVHAVVVARRDYI